MNTQPLLDALDIQENAARSQADDLRARSANCRPDCGRPRRTSSNPRSPGRPSRALPTRLPTVTPDLPEHPDYPRILAVFNKVTGPLQAKDVCQALDHELLPKNRDDTRAKLKHLVKLGILTEADTGSFIRKQ